MIPLPLALGVAPAAASAAMARRRTARCEQRVAPPTRVTVIGAGAVGVMTAYSLARRGIKVRLLDSQSEAAVACSNVNAGSLGRLGTRTIAHPAQILRLGKAVVLGDPVFRLDFVGMFTSVKFWRFAFPYAFAVLWFPWRHRNEAFSLNNMKWMADVMVEAIEREQVGPVQRGMLLVHMDGMAPPTGPPKEAGHSGTLLTAEEAVQKEPMLADVRERIVAAMELPGHPYAECGETVRKLLKVCQEKYGVDVMYNAPVAGLRDSFGAITSIHLVDDRIIKIPLDEAVVICAGEKAPQLLEPLQVRAPVIGMRGYSVTTKNPPGGPKQMLVLEPEHLYASPYSGGNVRFASIAEFGGGYAPNVATELGRGREAGIQVIRNKVKDNLPQLLSAVENPKDEMCGARPQLPDDQPMVGRAPRFTNLYVNVGHGQFGWQMSGGCAELVAAAMTGETTPCVDPACLSPARFDKFQAPWKWVGGVETPGPRLAKLDS